MKYHFAGYWIRMLAYSIDVTLLMTVIDLLMSLLDRVMPDSEFGATQSYDDGTGLIAVLAVIIGYVLIMLYFALMESSKWQATLGQKLFRFRVINKYGNRISLTKAIARWMYRDGWLPILTIGSIMIVAAFYTELIGHWLVAVTLTTAGTVLMIWTGFYGSWRIGWNSHKQGLFDTWADTYVIYNNPTLNKLKYLPGTEPEE